MGCPAPKIVKQGAGSALMGDIKKAESIIRASRIGLEQKGSSLPLSVKFRLGVDDDTRNWLDFGIMAEAAGAEMITLHPRTAREMYLGHSHWECIEQLVKKVNVPVIGNGDVRNLEDFNDLLSGTGCSGVMIGRGSFGNPWIFRAVKDGSNYAPSDLERIGMGLVHAKMLTEELPERIAILQMRKHIAWYIKGMPGAGDVRQVINVSSSLEQLNDVLLSYADRLDSTSSAEVMAFSKDTEKHIRETV